MTQNRLYGDMVVNEAAPKEHVLCNFLTVTMQQEKITAREPKYQHANPNIIRFFNRTLRDISPSNLQLKSFM